MPITIPTDYTERTSIPTVLRADGVGVVAQGQWTYATYAALPPDDLRHEIIGGVLYMAPAPNTAHQGAITRFVAYLFRDVEQVGLGRVLPAPCDVELAAHTVVQPDVVVVLAARQHIITPARVIGVPDLVLEIASPGTVTYDRHTKLEAYARAGVPEYWLADPASRTVEVLVLQGQRYMQVGVFAGAVRLPSRIIPTFAATVEQCFV